MMEILAYTLAVFIGISLGLIGSGGSILTIPILVYLMGIEPLIATAYSLFIVGTSALIGGIRKAVDRDVNYKMVIYFGIPSIFMVLFTRAFIMPNIPPVLVSYQGHVLEKGTFIMILLAVIMLLASISMIRKQDEDYYIHDGKFDYKVVFVKGLILGLVTGTVGAGGGFLIIPTLVISARMEMKYAVGTSLFIVAFNSLIGFLGYLEVDKHPIEWPLLLFFSGASAIGIFIGAWFATKIEGQKLKTGFGWFVLVMGLYMLFREVF